MIDTHCHLDFCEDSESAADNSLAAMVTIGTTLERSKRAVEQAEQHPKVYAAVGVHPTDAEEAQDDATRSAIETLAQHPKVVAIGESGFDFYWDKSSEEHQEYSFRWQAQLAQDCDKALVLHVRDKQDREKASLKSLELIKVLDVRKGILHCCNGHQALVATGLEQGWHVSFAGNLTYKKALEIQAVAKEVPRDRILLETDSPFLAPVPKRGKRNIPEYVYHTATFLAELRGESFEEVEGYTDENARRLLGL